MSHRKRVLSLKAFIEEKGAVTIQDVVANVPGYAEKKNPERVAHYDLRTVLPEIGYPIERKALAHNTGLYRLVR